ncbi:MAG: fibronectin type III domain-containing protein [Prevotella sp.]|nr:fibronectin type III domain-containing protein [Prevotella sp.]MBS7208783.1 fibronectin type III domain-containing protein [Prevotella sp.]
MKKNLLKMALLAFATFAASVASAQTYSGKITSSDWPKDKGLESDVDYSLTYIESTKKLNFEFTVPCDKKINVAYFFAEHGFGETTIKNPQSVDGTYTLSGTTIGAFVLEKGAETWFTLKLVIDGVGDIVTNRIAYKAGEGNTAEDTEAPAWVSDPTAVASSTSATISVNANDNVSKTLTYEVSEAADFATVEATVNGKANGTTEIALKGLSPETDYTYYVRVKDMAGNVGDVKTVTFTTTAQAAVVATYYGVFYTNDWAEKVTVDGKEVAPQINWKAETLEGYNDVIVTAELSEALPVGAALKFCAFIEGGVGPVDNKVMAATGKANEYTIKLSEVLPEGTTLAKDQIFGQFFFRLFPTGEGAFSMTKILTAEYKVGASNDPIATDTKAPEWSVDPVVEKVTDKTAEIVVNVTDDSGSAVITLTGDNGFAELKKEVKADGSVQTIVLNGLTANTTYNLTLAIADAAGNAGESKTVNFTTLETPDREVLYHSFDFTSENWKKYGETNSFAPNGRLLLTVNADNTVTVKVTVDEGVEAVEFAEFILHGIDAFRINVQEDGSFVGTSTKSISNRDASQAFNMNFVLKNGVGNSVFEPLSFTPSEGSTSAVAEVETEAAKVVAANGVIRVEGDKTFAVYTVAGQLAFRGMGEVRLDKGVYVVVVDGKAQKVML